MPRGFDDVPGSLPPDRISPDLDLNTIPFSNIAENVLQSLSDSVFDDAALWRDHLSMTGQIRTFSGGERIREQWASYCKEKSPRFQDAKSEGFQTNTKLILDRCSVHLQHCATRRVSWKLLWDHKFCS